MKSSLALSPFQKKTGYISGLGAQEIYWHSVQGKDKLYIKKRELVNPMSKFYEFEYIFNQAVDCAIVK